MTHKAKNTLGASLKKLEEISTWFQSQEEIDIEQGIAKAREGAELLKRTRKELAEVENAFEEIKKSLEE